MKILITLLLIISAINVKADQLTWVTLQQAKIATNFLNDQKEILSWCACCDDDKFNLIKIQGSYYKKIEGEADYYYVYILGKDNNGAEINEYFDLAYLHYEKNGMAICLAIGLGFECDPCTPIFKWPFTNVYSNNNLTDDDSIDSDGFKYAATAKDGSIYSVLIEKTVYNDVKIWVKNTVPVKKFKNSTGKLVESGGGHILTFMVINCTEKEFTIEEKVTYNRKGDLVKSDTIASFSNKIVPGSVMTAIYSNVCSK